MSEELQKKTPALTRGAIPYQHRSIAWYDPVTGEILHEADGEVLYVQPGAPISDVLRIVRSRVLYMLPDGAGRPADRPWFAECTRIGCSIEKYLAKVHAATISRAEKRIDIYPITQYFDTPPSVSACKQSWQLLASLLRGAFGERSMLLATASSTGLHLLRLALPDGQRYEVLPDDIRETILHNFGQGRIETFYNEQPLTDVYEVDGTWMYADCLRDVPTGPITHDFVNELHNKGYTAGFYRVEATIPDDWQHIGLLPAYDKKVARRRADTKTWYPRQPGHSFESWATSSELRLARDHGWTFTIRERTLWCERSSDPLRLWGDRLKRLRERCEHLEEPQRTMLRQAIRNIVLRGIGSFNRHEISRDSYVPLSEIENLPDSVESWDIEDEDTVHILSEADLMPQQQQTLQPHWASRVWGEARVKLAKAALCVPFDQIIALRTDGIWTTYDVRLDENAIWHETPGKPGSWRVKHEAHEPLHWPKNNTEMVGLLQYVKGRH